MANTKDRSSPAAGSQVEIGEKRREQRYVVPNACRQYIKLQVKNGNELVPAILGNFSRNGILFECPLSFSQGERTECVLRLSFLLSREISFGIEVKYCYADNDTYIVGASIDVISDEIWFNFFVDVHDFIVLHQ